MTIDIKILIFAIWCIFMLVSLVVNICLLIAIKKQSSKSFSSAVKNAAETAETVFKRLNLNGIGDVIGLIKDIVSTPTDDEGAGGKDEQSK